MEAEARAILETALSLPEEDPTDRAAFARNLFTPLCGVELELPARAPLREPPAFASVPDDAADTSLSLLPKPSDAASGQEQRKPISPPSDAPIKTRRRRL